MEQIIINPDNECYYLEEFIKGFKCGAARQFKADLTDRTRGEVNAVEIYEKAVNQLEHNEITIGEFEKVIEPLKHLFYGGQTPKGVDDEHLLR